MSFNKLPQKIKIGFKEYEIVRKEEVFEDQECYGKIDYNKEKIYISTRFNQNQRNATFLHEMIHGIFEKLDMNDLRENEQVVNQIAVELYLIIKENPDIFKMTNI